MHLTDGIALDWVCRKDGATLRGKVCSALGKACAILFEQAPTLCRDGGTGRRSGLKIRRGQPHRGSIPLPGTIKSITYKIFLRPARATSAPSSQLCSQLDVQSWHRGIVRCREYGKRKSIEGYSKGTRGAMFGWFASYTWTASEKQGASGRSVTRWTSTKPKRSESESASLP